MTANSCFVARAAALAVVVACGCSGGKTEDPAPPPRDPKYAEPPPSPIAQSDVAKKLRTYFAESELTNESSGGSSTVSSDSSPITKTNVDEEIYPGFEFMKDTGWKEKCQTAVGRYLADLAKQCQDLGGEMTIGEPQPTDIGFRITSPYTLPAADTCQGRSGTVEIELKLNEDKWQTLFVLINEEARGMQLPID